MTVGAGSKGAWGGVGRRSVVLAALLASGGCSLRDWGQFQFSTRDGSSADAAQEAPDGGEPDVDYVVDTGRLDTGPSDPSGSRCGDENEPCCAFGECSSGTVCLPRDGGLAPVCRDCGDDGEPCCAFGACASGRVCLPRAGLTPVCRDCGDDGEPCCAGRRCEGHRRCERRPDGTLFVCR